MRSRLTSRRRLHHVKLLTLLKQNTKVQTGRWISLLIGPLQHQIQELAKMLVRIVLPDPIRGRSVIYYLVTSCCSSGFFQMTYLWKPHPSSIMAVKKVSKGHGCKSPMHLKEQHERNVFKYKNILISAKHQSVVYLHPLTNQQISIPVASYLWAAATNIWGY